MDFLTRFGINRGRVTVLVIAALLLLGFMQYQALPKREDPAVTSRHVSLLCRLNHQDYPRNELKI